MKSSPRLADVCRVAGGLLSSLLLLGAAQAGQLSKGSGGLFPQTIAALKPRFDGIPQKEYRSEDGNEIWIGQYGDGAINRVSAIAIAHDGRIVASAGDRDRVIYVWDVLEMNAPPPAVLEGHRGAIRALAISPDRSRIASASADKTLRIWSVASEETASVLTGHEGPVLAVAFSPKGDLIASGSQDKTVRVWEVARARELSVLQGHQSAVRSIAFTPDGRLIVSGAQDGAIRVAEIANPASARTIGVAKTPVTALAVSPDGKLAAAGTAGRIHLWDLATGRQSSIIEQGVGGYITRAAAGGGVEQVFDEEPVSAVAFSPKGDRVLVGFVGRVASYDAASGALLGTLTGSDLVGGELGGGAFSSVAISTDGIWVAAGMSDLTVRVWGVGQIKPEEDEKLGTGETRCEGDACGGSESTLTPTSEGNCIWFTNVSTRTIEVTVGYNRAEASIVLKPGEKKKLPFCGVTWTGLGLYRASFLEP